MKVIEAKNANFLVGASGLRLSTKSGTILEFYEGDGIRFVNKSDNPCLEFYIGGKPVSIEVPKKLFKKVVERLIHSTEFKVKKIELMDAVIDSKLSTEDLVKSYSSVIEEQNNKSEKSLTVVVRVMEMGFDKKVSKVVETKSDLPKSINTLTLEDAGDSEEDPDKKKDEEDDDEDPDKKDMEESEDDEEDPDKKDEEDDEDPDKKDMEESEEDDEEDPDKKTDEEDDDEDPDKKDLDKEKKNGKR